MRTQDLKEKREQALAERRGDRIVCQFGFACELGKISRDS